MKQFIIFVFVIAACCVGLGSLVDRVSAGHKSDERALAIIRDARQAIGGETAINGVRSMVIGGNVTRTIKVDGVEKSVQGETEIAMQLPDKLMKTIAIKDGNAPDGDKMIQRQVDVVVVGGDKDKMKVMIDDNGTGSGVAEKRIVIKKDDGTVQEFTGAEADKIAAADGANGGKAVKKIVIKNPDGTTQVFTGADADKFIAEHGGNDVSVTRDGKSHNENIMVRRTGPGEAHDESMKHNEMLRLTLSLLLTAPQGMDVDYTYSGETDVDGTACNIVTAETGGAVFKLFIGKTSSLPVMMTYTGMKMPQVVMFRTKAPDGNAPKADLTFTRKIDAPPMETAEFTVKFADYRAVNGVKLPFKWTQTIGGATDEVFDVASYDINPADIAGRFKNEKMKVKMKTTDQD
jgi:hypothetical protein